MATFCSGAAPLWAERSSLVSAAGEVAAEAVAVWVHLQSDGTRPEPLPAGFHSIYGPSAMGRRVRARLRHPPEPPAGAAARPWHFRAADLDLAGHVNNAVYWEALEDDLVAREPAAGLEAEIEHRAPAGAGAATVLSHGPMRWITDPAGDRRRDARGAAAVGASGRERERDLPERGAPVLDRGRHRDPVAGAGLRHGAVQRPLGERVGEALLDAGRSRSPGRTARRAGPARRASRSPRRERARSRSRGRARAATTVARSITRSLSSRARSTSTVKPRRAAARDPQRPRLDGAADLHEPVDLARSAARPRAARARSPRGSTRGRPAPRRDEAQPGAARRLRDRDRVAVGRLQAAVVRRRRRPPRAARARAPRRPRRGSRAVAASGSSRIGIGAARAAG